MDNEEIVYDVNEEQGIKIDKNISEKLIAAYKAYNDTFQEFYEKQLDLEFLLKQLYDRKFVETKDYKKFGKISYIEFHRAMFQSTVIGHDREEGFTKLQKFFSSQFNDLHKFMDAIIEEKIKFLKKEEKIGIEL